MHTVNRNNDSSQRDTDWVFMTDLSIDEIKRKVEFGDEPASGLHFQDVDIPLVYLNEVLCSLVDFPHQALKRARPEVSAMVRLFCQANLIRTENQLEPFFPTPKAAGLETVAPAIPEMSGGWGYFLVEKSV
jgi:hypothetical protein